MNFNLYHHTIWLVVSGSHAYGFATEKSDYDYRGIAIAPMDLYIGLLPGFQQHVSKEAYVDYPVGMLQDDPRDRHTAPGRSPDMQVMELTKFVDLALKNNPSVLETIFTPGPIIEHPVMRPLLANRDKLLSKAVKARFCGYAYSQLGRIRRHKRWLDDPPTHKPAREDFGLPNQSLLSQDQIGAAEALIQRELDEFMIDQEHVPEDVRIEFRHAMDRMMKAVWHSLNKERPYPVGPGQIYDRIDDALYWGVADDQNFSENFLRVLAKEKQYRQAKGEWDKYQTWLKQRNADRAVLEAQFGYDTKHGSHLVRLMRMAREILETGEVRVKREDAEELLAIRNGAWTFDELIEFAEREDLALNEVAKKSNLPRVPDRDLFHIIVRGMIEEFNRDPL